MPHAVVNRLTSPVVVHPYNQRDLTERMERGAVLFLQRRGQARMRAIGHVAVQRYVPEAADRLLRRGNKYPLHRPPLPIAEDVPLPVQCADLPNTVQLCFGDRILRACDRARIDPLRTVTWPVLRVGDTVLVTPRDGDVCLMNRQPTLVRPRARHARRGRGHPGIDARDAHPRRAQPHVRGLVWPDRGAARRLWQGAPSSSLSSRRRAASRDGDEINLHLPQGVHVTSELQRMLP